MIKSKNQYYKYLDGYRFVAVFMVIISHWLPKYLENYPFARVGVDMFFVLSGFLITEILLKQKPEINTEGNFNLRKSLFAFYARRSLRIFPIYYIVIIFFWIAGAFIIKQNWPYFLFYATNFLVIKNGSWIGMFSHLWSLAIEEQFYFFWPLIILIFPLKYLGKIIPLCIISSIVYILISRSAFLYYDIFACLSTLAAGGYLAFAKTMNTDIFKRQSGDFPALLICGAGILSISLKFFDNPFVLHLATLFFSFFLVKILITRSGKFADIIFGNALISFLGRISYGLYLFHLFIPWLLRNLNGTENELIINKKIFISPAGNGLVIIVEEFVLLFAVAIISWYMIERPFNSLKKYFSYS